MNPNDELPDNFCEGDYVQVTSPPGPWEGSGESDEDRKSYVGHIGVVVETDDLEECGMFALVRFVNWAIVETGQRSIEWSCLKFIAHPENPITRECFDN